MEVYSLDTMVGGWIVGDFDPCLIRNRELEVAVKTYAKGAVEPSHHHRIAEEFTLIASGKARMGKRQFDAGKIIRIAPGESTDFEALEDTITVVVKTPSVPQDKYLDSRSS